MLRVAKNSRQHEPIENIVGDEQPTQCIHCAARTEIVTILENGNQEEVCLNCGQLYEVEFEMEVVDEDGLDFYDRGPTDATQEQLDHPLGPKPSPYEDFGSF